MQRDEQQERLRETMVLSSVVRASVIAVTTLAGTVLAVHAVAGRDVFTAIATAFLLVLYGSSVCVRLCSSWLGNTVFVAVFWGTLWIANIIPSALSDGSYSLRYWNQLFLLGWYHLMLQLFACVVYRGTKTGRRES